LLEDFTIILLRTLVAGLLAYGSLSPLLPMPVDRHSGNVVSPRLQWRDRPGFPPGSLFSALAAPQAIVFILSYYKPAAISCQPFLICPCLFGGHILNLSKRERACSR